MEKPRHISAPVMLKGLNYLLWSRTMRTTLCSHGLWSHVLLKEAPTMAAIEEGDSEIQDKDDMERITKWFQEDQMVLSIIQNSLESSLLEAYSYCETANELWETLKNVYGNSSNLLRIYEVKKAINELHQEDMEFTKHFGQFRSLWAELEMLRPNSIDPIILTERREQDKVFGLLMTLHPNYSDLIKHLLREEKLPSLEDVCAKVQKEQGTYGLFGSKEGLFTANKGHFKPEDKKNSVCNHCKKKGHTKDQCWILHPHLKPSKWNAQTKAHLSQEGGHQSRSLSPYHGGHNTNLGGASQASAFPTQMALHSGISSFGGCPIPSQVGASSSQNEYVKKSDLDALIKALKENSGNVIGKSLHASYNACNVSKPLIVDSGASHHMISDLGLIENVEPALGHVVIANGARVPIQGIGNLRLFNKKSKAFYMPTFTSNLLSIKRATTDLNCHAIFSPNDMWFQDIKTNQVLGKGVSKDDLYVLEDLTPSSSSSALVSTSCLFNSNNASVVKADLWHARLGHPHVRALELLFPKTLFNNENCEACILGKHCRSIFTRSETTYNECFELVHTDVWTSPCESRDHHKYFVTFIDEKSKYTWITLLPSKDKTLEAFINFHSYVSNHYNVKIKCLRSDNGGEYTSHAFTQFLSKQGIIHQTSCPYTPQQNGVAERKNRHLMEVARSMMFHRNVPKRFWSDAVLTATYLINRIPTKILRDQSPFEVLNKTKPTFDHLKVFGCVCFVLNTGDHHSKLDARSTKAMFIGYSPTQKGYKCYVPEKRRVFISRDVKFMEDKSYYEDGTWADIKDISNSPSDRADHLRQLLDSLGLSQPCPPPTSPDSPPAPHAPFTTPPAAPNSSMTPESSSADDSTNVPGNLDPEGGNVSEASDGHDQDEPEQEEEPEGEHETMQPPEEGEPHNQLRRSSRQKFPPSHWKNTRVYYNAQAEAHPIQAVCSLAHVPADHHTFTVALDQESVPRNYEEAKEHKVWRDAVGEERNAMERNHTWDEADLPTGKRTVSSRWIFTIKYKSNGEIERYKARLVARGFTQTYGEDYRDTFAPVAKLHTIRVILSLATNLEWDLWQMDVKNAFLQGELEEEVYMTPPPGLEDTVAPGKVLRLRKAIYGLKQSPRAWYHKLSVTLRDRGFRRSESDHTLFTLQSQEGIVVILIYVDDIIISGNDKVGIASTKEYLKSVFDIKDLGELKYFLGIEVCRTKEGLFISQRKYVLDLLTDAGMLEAKEAKTPLEDGYKVEPEGELGQEEFKDQKLYRKMVGKLIYLTITRPDLCFAVNQVSQHMQNPMVFHWRMVERILRYLKGTHDQGIWMGNNKSVEIVGYCDADWAGDRKDRRSTTGYCTFIGGNLVTWKTKKQKVVSCSSAEAEYRAMRKLTTECIWLKALLQDLGIESKTPITMHCDNQAAIHIASNSVFHERTKHIEVDCHKVREAVEKGIILPCYTRSSDQLADIFTKAASLKVCEFIHARLGLIDLPCP